MYFSESPKLKRMQQQVEPYEPRKYYSRKGHKAREELWFQIRPQNWRVRVILNIWIRCFTSFLIIILIRVVQLLTSTPKRKHMWGKRVHLYIINEWLQYEKLKEIQGFYRVLEDHITIWRRRSKKGWKDSSGLTSFIRTGWILSDWRAVLSTSPCYLVPSSYTFVAKLMPTSDEITQYNYFLCSLSILFSLNNT